MKNPASVNQAFQPLTVIKTGASKCKNLNRRFKLICGLLLVGLTVLIALSLLLGAASLTITEVMSALLRTSPGSTAYEVIWNLRLPRTLLAIVVGAHFALAGLILQSVIRNPLADPSVIGVSGGASLAIVVFLLLIDVVSGTLYSGQTVVSLSWLPFVGLSGGILTAALVLGLSWKASVSPAKLALNGVAVGAVLNAAVMWTVLAWGGGRTETSILWLAGSLYGRDFLHLWTILPWTLAGVTLLVLIQRPLSLLRLNDDLSQSLGLSLLYWRVIAISIAVALAASAIAVAGAVGFVGLIVPHLARLLVGSQMQQLNIVTFLCGSCLMLVADIISRMIVHPLELPAGTLTTLLGIPVLLFLLQRQSGESRC